jgi:Rab-GTPase-TBC domain
MRAARSGVVGHWTLPERAGVLLISLNRIVFVELPRKKRRNKPATIASRAHLTTATSTSASLNDVSATLSSSSSPLPSPCAEKSLTTSTSMSGLNEVLLPGGGGNVHTLSRSQTMPVAIEADDDVVAFNVTVIPISEVLQLAKRSGPERNSAGLGALRIVTKSDKFFFSHVRNVGRVLALASQLQELMGERVLRRIGCVLRDPRVCSVDDTSVAAELERRRINDNYIRRFRLPRSEIMLARFGARLCQGDAAFGGADSKRVADMESGNVYLSHHFVCFASSSTRLVYFLGDDGVEIAPSKCPCLASTASADSAADERSPIDAIRLANAFSMIYFLPTQTKCSVVLDNVQAARRATLDDMRTLRERHARKKGSNGGTADDDEQQEASLFYVRSPHLDGIAQRSAPFGVDASLLADPLRGFSADYEELREAKRLSEWALLFATHGRGVSFRRTPELRRFVLGGVPNQLRGEVWPLLAGARHHQLLTPTLYADLLAALHVASVARNGNGDDKNGNLDEFVEQIDKDLFRSLHGHALGDVNGGVSPHVGIPWENPECMAALRRVLVAYAYRNPAVGYAQGMHELAGLLLIFMSEADAFHMLAYICETLCPHHFAHNLIGSLCEVDVLKEFIDHLMPALAEHLRSDEFPGGIEMLHCELYNWIIPWFIHGGHGVNLEATLRILDWMFLDGPGNCVLLQCALAILKILEERLLVADFETLRSTFENAAIDADELIGVASRQFGWISASEYVGELRAYYKMRRVTEAFNAAIFDAIADDDTELLSAQIAPPTLRQLDFLLPSRRAKAAAKPALQGPVRQAERKGDDEETIEGDEESGDEPGEEQDEEEQLREPKKTLASSVAKASAVGASRVGHTQRTESIDDLLFQRRRNHQAAAFKPLELVAQAQRMLSAQQQHAATDASQSAASSPPAAPLTQSLPVERSIVAELDASVVVAASPASSDASSAVPSRADDASSSLRQLAFMFNRAPNAQDTSFNAVLQRRDTLIDRRIHGNFINVNNEAAQMSIDDQFDEE